MYVCTNLSIRTNSLTCIGSVGFQKYTRKQVERDLKEGSVGD